MKILGIDPGSRLMGFGAIEKTPSGVRVLTHGTFAVLSKDENENHTHLRLKRLYQKLCDLIEEVNPDVLVVEKVFFAKNADSAFKLGQARGVVLLCGGLFDLKVAEYTPTEVKLGLTGHGRAEKEQVAKMVEVLVGKQQFKTWDASDALALALCHWQMSRTNPLLLY